MCVVDVVVGVACLEHVVVVVVFIRHSLSLVVGLLLYVCVWRC